MLMDAHIHLQDIRQQSTANAILAHARTQGIGRFFCNATSPTDWEAVRDIASHHDWIRPFFGVHPWYVEGLEDNWFQRLSDCLDNPCAGIGEIGLDKAKIGVDFEKQKEVFGRQVEMAIQTRRPFVVHCVRAWQETLDIISSYDPRDTPFMMHSFAGSEIVLSKFIELGGYISFSLKLLGNWSQKINELFSLVPLERLFLETDFPYLYGVGTDIDMESEADEYFKSVRRLYEIASDLKGIDTAVLKKQIWENGTVFAH